MCVCVYVCVCVCLHLTNKERVCHLERVRMWVCD